METKIDIKNFDKDIEKEMKQIIMQTTEEFKKLDLFELRGFCENYHKEKLSDYKNRFDGKEYFKISIPLKEWKEPDKIEIIGADSPATIEGSSLWIELPSTIHIVKMRLVKVSKAEGYYVIQIGTKPGCYIGMFGRCMSFRENIIHELLMLQENMKNINKMKVFTG